MEVFQKTVAPRPGAWEYLFRPFGLHTRPYAESSERVSGRHHSFGVELLYILRRSRRSRSRNREVTMTWPSARNARRV